MPEQKAEQIAFSFGGSHTSVTSVSNHRTEKVTRLIEKLAKKRYERDDCFKLAVCARDAHDKYHPKVDHWLMMREVACFEIDHVLEELYALGHIETTPDMAENHQGITIKAFGQLYKPVQLQLIKAG